MATSRGVGVFFRQFLRQIRSNQINTAVPIAQYSTEKDEITNNPFFEKYAAKIKHARGSQRYDHYDHYESTMCMGNILRQLFE